MHTNKIANKLIGTDDETQLTYSIVSMHHASTDPKCVMVIYDGPLWAPTTHIALT